MCKICEWSSHPHAYDSGEKFEGDIIGGFDYFLERINNTHFKLRVVNQNNTPKDEFEIFNCPICGRKLSE